MKAKSPGDLYVQILFAEDGKVADTNPPPIKVDLEQIVKEENAPIVGKLKVHVVHAYDLPIMDSFLEGSKIDPFVNVIFGKTKYTTKVVKQNTTAIWKEVFTFDVNVPKKVRSHFIMVNE